MAQRAVNEFGNVRYRIRPQGTNEVIEFWFPADTPEAQATQIMRSSIAAQRATGSAIRGTDPQGRFPKRGIAGQPRGLMQGNVRQTLQPTPGAPNVTLPSPLQQQQNLAQGSYIDRIRARLQTPNRSDLPSGLNRMLSESILTKAEQFANSPVGQAVLPEIAPAVGELAGGVVGFGAGSAAGGIGAIPGAAMGSAAGANIARSGQNLINLALHHTGLVPGAETPSSLTPQRVAQDATLDTTAGLLGGAGAALTPNVARIPTRAQLLSDEFEVPFDPAQQGSILPQALAQLRTILRRGFVSAQRFGALDERQRVATLQAKDKMVREWVSGVSDDLFEVSKGGSPQAGRAIQDMMDIYDRILGADFAQVEGMIIRNGDVPLPTERLVGKATEVIQDLTEGPIGAGLEAYHQDTLKILREFLNLGPQTTVSRSPILDSAGNAITTQVTQPGATLTFSQAVRLRRNLFALTNDPNLTGARVRLKALTHEVHRAMEEGLTKAGRGRRAGGGILDPSGKPLDEAAWFRETSEAYARGQELLEQELFKSAARKGNPDGILASMLRAGSETTFDSWNQMVATKPKLLKKVRVAAFETIFQRASTPAELGEAAVLGNKLTAHMENLGVPALKKIFGLQYRKVQRFVDMVDQLSLPVDVTRPITAKSSSLLAQGQAGTVGIVGGALRVGGTLLSWAGLAKVMAEPGGLDTLIRLLDAPSGSRRAIDATTRLFSLMAKVEAQNRNEAPQIQRRPSGPTIQ